MATKPKIMIGHFQFAQFVENDKGVQCAVRFMRGRTEDMNAEREKEVKSLLEYMGRWENLIKFFGDSGLTDHSRESQKFGRNLYEVDTQLHDTDGYRELYIKFWITKEDSLLRTEVMDSAAKLSVGEITEQIANIDKWKNFETLIQSSKKLLHA